ncbi:MAG TPA: ISAs1 family transposase [Ktedonobacterales bacterium]|jgi:predicted transposase YbfD/YdcC
MYSTVLPVTLPPLTDSQRHDLLYDAALLSLHDAFAAVPDPRSRHGRRYDLPFLLTCFVAALLCNCTHSEAVGQWCRAEPRLLRRLFGSRRFVTPTGALYRWLFPQLNALALEQVLAAWVQATLVADPNEPVALDGKTLRGARTSTQAAPHLLSFCTYRSHETLLQVRVEEKTNEIPVAQTLLPTLPLRGRVCTADALHTQVALMRVLHEAQAETVLTVKENQPSLLADLITYFADSAACYQQAETWDCHRGRIEVRRIKVSTEMTTYLAATWPYVAQVAQLTRCVTKQGQTRQEVVYLITSLTPAQAPPQRLLDLIRGHWHIENGLHYVRDVTFGEDRSQLRTGNAPQVMASLRNLAITLIHRTGSTQIAATRRYLAFHPRHALYLILHQRNPPR